MNQESRIKVKKNKIKSIIHDSPACSRLRRQPMAGRLFMIHSKGFTLIELLVVIAIIGILASFLLANFIGVRQRARDGVRKSDLRQIQSALELYRSDWGGYPTFSLTCGCALTSSATAVDCSASPPGTVYMKKIPCDPSGGTAVYTYSGQGVCAMYCPAYSLIACLENTNDSQKDPSVNSACTSKTNISYTLQNP